MSAKTKIVVLHMKELICAGLLATAGLFLVILLFVWMSHDNPVDQDPQSTPDVALSPSPDPTGLIQESLPVSSYLPGVYKTQLELGGQTIEVEAVLESDHISSLRLVNLDDAITTMYPLLQPTMDNICAQIYEKHSLDQVTYEAGAKYTSLVLLEAIRSCLEKASLSQSRVAFP